MSNGFQTFLKSSSKKIDPQGSIFFGLSEFAAFPSADGEEVYGTDKGSSLYHAQILSDWSDDPSVGNFNLPLTNICYSRIMGDNDNGLSLIVQRLEKRHDLAGSLGV